MSGIKFYQQVDIQIDTIDNPDMDIKGIEAVTSILTKHYPSLQAIYLFGSSVEGDIANAADVDIALLFPYDSTILENSIFFSDAKVELERYFSRPVDLVLLRKVSTVFRNEILCSGSRIYTKDIYAAETFEMITVSLYQKLNEERKEILEEVFRTNRAVDV